MARNLLETKAKKVIESTLRLVGGRKFVGLVKSKGKKYLARRAAKLKNSSQQDIAQIQFLQPKYLHFGCGDRVIKGWANIDLRLNADWEEKYQKYFSFEMDKKGTRNDFFRIDFTEAGIPLPDNSVEGIFHEDFIEHINQRDTFVFLTEAFRVLKPGRVHRVSTPDLAASMRRHSDFSKGKAGVYTNEWNKHEHYNIFTPKYLEEVARLIGYSQVIFTTRTESRLKPLPTAYRPGNDKLSDAEQIFCDLIK